MDAELLAAGLLHDTFKDTDAMSFEDIELLAAKASKADINIGRKSVVDSLARGRRRTSVQCLEVRSAAAVRDDMPYCCTT